MALKVGVLDESSPSLSRVDKTNYDETHDQARANKPGGVLLLFFSPPLILSEFQYMKFYFK